MTNTRFFAISIMVCLGWLALSGWMDMRREAFERDHQDRAAALCVPGPGEITHSALEPDGSIRCAISRRGGLITRLEVRP